MAGTVGEAGNWEAKQAMVCSRSASLSCGGPAFSACHPAARTARDFKLNCHGSSPALPVGHEIPRLLRSLGMTEGERSVSSGYIFPRRSLVSFANPHSSGLASKSLRLRRILEPDPARHNVERAALGLLEHATEIFTDDPQEDKLNSADEQHRAQDGSPSRHGVVGE